MGRSVKSNKRVVAMAVTFGVLAAGTGIVGCRATRAGGDPREPVAVQRPEYRPDGERVVNLLTDVSHDYSFNLSWADRNQREIYPGFNCLTSVRTIHRAALGPINALVLLLHAKLPYSQEDAGHVLRYVAEGGGVYLSVNTEGDFRASLDAFLKPFGLQSGDGLSDDPADWGICAHAPSELTFEVGGRYARFTARVGLWGDGARGSVGFEVYGDDRLLFESEVLRGTDRAAIDVDVKGVATLRLVATDGGDGKTADASTWYDPRLCTTAGVAERVLLKDASSVAVGWSRASQDEHFGGFPLGAKSAEDAEARTGEIKSSAHPAAIPGASYKQVRRARLETVPGAQGWQTVYGTADGQPVVSVRSYGKGVIVVDRSGLYGKANDKDETARGIMRRLVDYMASGKTVQAVKGGGGWQGSSGYHWDLVKATDDGLRIHHNDYTTMYVDNDITAYRRCAGYLQRLSGLSVEMKARQIREKRQREESTFKGARLSIDISGVKELSLETTDGGDGKHADHSVWGDAFLVDAEGGRVKLLLAAAHVETGYGEPTQDSHEGVPISVGGTVCETGIYIHAPSRMRFAVGGTYSGLVARVGCQDTFGGSVGFRVTGDGKTLWESPTVYRGGIPGGDPDDINYVPDGVLFRIRYLACRGAGFLLPQGAAVDLPEGLEDDWQVHLGMFAHEMGHAWSYPYCEVMGEEASAFIFNNLVLHRHHGQKHGDSVTKRLVNYLKKETIDEADLAQEADNFKYYMFIDLMIREYGEDVWRNYNLLKYALLNLDGTVWNAHTTAWLWSIAAGTDVFPRFTGAFGTSVSKDDVRLPADVLKLGFDPEAVGKRYGLPVERLPRGRRIFDRLRDFSDVREFYRVETADRGHPKVEG